VNKYNIISYTDNELSTFEFFKNEPNIQNLLKITCCTDAKLVKLCISISEANIICKKYNLPISFVESF
jgi:hypothetical protein